MFGDRRSETTRRMRRRILRRDFGLCQYCEAPADHVDHVWPVTLGGASVEENLVAACAHCNQSKGAALTEPWMRRLVTHATSRDAYRIGERVLRAVWG